MKKIIGGISLIIAACFYSSCEKNDENLGYSLQDTVKTLNITSGKAVDMVLIYQGGVHRPDWTTSQLAPYVTYVDPSTKKEDWLYDGFLFLEFADGSGRSLVAPVKDGETIKSGRKAEWEMVLNNQFALNKGIDALNKQITEKIKTLGTPKRKRKVVISIPEPRPGQLDWGALNGIELNFNSQADRLIAVKWYIDQILTRWQAINPENLELAGFYWVAESAYISQVSLPIIKSYIGTKGKYYFYHIPHWGAMVREGWKRMGFDISYQQPNVFFHSTRIVSVAEVIKFAKQNGLALEYEFDENVMASKSDADKRGRFMEYFNEFEKEGIFDNYPLTYYQSHFAWSTLVSSTDPKDVELSKMLAQKILQRQKKADELNTP